MLERSLSCHVRWNRWEDRQRKRGARKQTRLSLQFTVTLPWLLVSELRACYFQAPSMTFRGLRGFKRRCLGEVSSCLFSTGVLLALLIVATETASYFPHLTQFQVGIILKHRSLNNINLKHANILKFHCYPLGAMNFILSCVCTEHKEHET